VLKIAPSDHFSSRESLCRRYNCRLARNEDPGRRSISQTRIGMQGNCSKGEIFDDSNALSFWTIRDICNLMVLLCAIMLFNPNCCSLIFKSCFSHDLIRSMLCYWDTLHFHITVLQHKAMSMKRGPLRWLICVINGEKWQSIAY